MLSHQNKPQKKPHDQPSAAGGSGHVNVDPGSSAPARRAASGEAVPMKSRSRPPNVGTRLLKPIVGSSADSPGEAGPPDALLGQDGVHDALEQVVVEGQPVERVVPDERG